MDIVKGIAIISMIFEHIYSTPIINSCHMPIFFFVSGYFLREKPLHLSLVKKCRQLLLPYFWYSLASLVTQIIFAVISLKTTDHSLLGKMIIENAKGYITTRGSWLLWFLPVLFFSSIGFIVICKISKALKNSIIRNVVIGTAIIIALLAGMQLAYKEYEGTIMLPFNPDICLIGMFYVACGVAYRALNAKINTVIKTLLFFLSVVMWIVSVMNDGMSMAIRYYPGLFFDRPILPYCILGAVGGVITMIYFGRFLSRAGVVAAVLSWYGRNSLHILCVANIITVSLFSYNFKAYSTLPVLLKFGIQLTIVSVVSLIWERLAFRKGTPRKA